MNYRRIIIAIIGLFLFIYPLFVLSNISLENVVIYLFGNIVIRSFFMALSITLGILMIIYVWVIMED